MAAGVAAAFLNLDLNLASPTLLLRYPDLPANSEQ